MIRFERSFDYELIRRIITHPKIWPHVSDDGSPPVEQYQPVRHEAMWYVIVRDIDDEREDLLGLWVFTPHNLVCWEVHTALLPLAWGERGQMASRMLPAWIWKNTLCRRIITAVPSRNRLALHFAVKAGMHVYGVNEASYQKNGKLYDQVCLGISRPSETVDVEELPDLIAEPEDVCPQP